MKQKPRVRDPARTRRRILEAAFVELRRAGFQKMKMERVLASAGLTKGALYHHFHNKQALGCALIDESVGPDVLERWLDPVAVTDDPLPILKRLLERLVRSTRKDEVSDGCPFTRISDELGPLGDPYASRLASIHANWRDGLAEALRRGQAGGFVSSRVEAESAAAMFIAGYQGVVLAGRIAPTKTFWMVSVDGLLRWLEALSPAADSTLYSGEAPLQPVARPPSPKLRRSDPAPPDERKDEVQVFRIGESVEPPE